jgi:hypothetical protein
VEMFGCAVKLYFFSVFDNEMYIDNFVQRTQKTNIICHFIDISLLHTLISVSDLKGNNLICMMMKEKCIVIFC